MKPNAPVRRVLQDPVRLPVQVDPVPALRVRVHRVPVLPVRVHRVRALPVRQEQAPAAHAPRRA